MPKIDPSIVESVVSAASAAIYRRDFAAFEAFAGAEDVTNPAQFAAWREHLIKQTTLAHATVQRMLTSVRMVMREAAARALISKAAYADFQFVRSAQARTMKGRERPFNKTRLTSEDVRRLCDARDASTLLGLRDRALLLTLASSGARISEVVTLAVDHVLANGQGRGILVNGKTDVEWRRAPLSAEAGEAIAAWLAARPVQSPCVFNAFDGSGARVAVRHISRTAAWQSVQKYAGQLGLDHVKPHDFRRFVATSLVRRNPRQAQLALGHKSLQTTYKHYVLDELEDGVVDNLF